MRVFGRRPAVFIYGSFSLIFTPICVIKVKATAEVLTLKTYKRFLLAIVLLLLISGYGPVQVLAEDKRALSVYLLIEEGLKQNYISQGYFISEVRKVFKRASEIFEKDIERRLEVVGVEVVSPPADIYSMTRYFILLDPVEKWLKATAGKKEGDLVVLLLGRSMLGDYFSEKTFVGYHFEKFVLARHHPLHSTVTAERILHEIGHFCNAKHSQSEESLMHPTKEGATSYGDQKSVVKESCG